MTDRTKRTGTIKSSAPLRRPIPKLKTNIINQTVVNTKLKPIDVITNI